MPDEIADLRDNAERCRRLATVVEEPKTKKMLEQIASEFEERAAVLEARHSLNPDNDKE